MSDVEALRAVYEEWARGNLRAGVELFAEDIRFVPMPDGGEGVIGPAAASAYMREFLSQWKDFRVAATRIEEVGDAILVTEHQTGTGAASGIQIDHTSYAAWRFEDGRVVEVRWEMDRDRALAR